MHRSVFSVSVVLPLIGVLLGFCVTTTARARFIQNLGQLPAEVRYYYAGPWATFYVTDRALVVDMKEPPPAIGVVGSHRRPRVAPEFGRPQDPHHDAPHRRGCAVWLRFDEIDRSAAIEGRGELRVRYNFFRGADPEHWQTEVPAYEEVVYRELWPGIDLAIRVESGGITCLCSDVPGQSSPAIRFQCDGAERVTEQADGSTLVVTAVGSFQLLAPENGIRAWYLLPAEAPTQREAGGHTGAPDAENQRLSGLRWSTFLGGLGGWEYGTSLALDPNGDVIIAGYTDAGNFPTTPGAYDVLHNGGYDAFVTKLDATGCSLIWSTFLGGIDWDMADALVLDGSGNPVLVGKTLSTNFPTTPGAYDPGHNGGYWDAFAAKLSASGSVLLWSTFLGGNAYDFAYALTLDDSENPLVAGETQSSNFPTTTSAYDRTFNGGADVFITKLEAAGRFLLWSTYLGGGGSEEARGIDLDPWGNPVLVGFTGSADFPTTPGAYDSTYNTHGDAFVARLDPSGSDLLLGSFLGGSVDGDYAYAVATDAAGNIILTGYTWSPDFPTTPEAYDILHNGGDDVFVVNMHVSGSSLLWSTFLGGAGGDYGWALALDGDGCPVIAGETRSAGFPITPGAFDNSLGGGQDAFVAALDPSGTSLRASTFLGGSSGELALALILDSEGQPIVTGETWSPDFPTTPDAYDRSFNGGYNDVFVTQLTAIGASIPEPRNPDLARRLCNRPNPFGSRTVIDFALDSAADANLRIFDITGREVAVLTQRRLAAGDHHLSWDGRGADGLPLNPGIYVVRLQLGREILQRQIVRIR